MKISRQTIIVLAVPCVVVCSGLLYQRSNEQQLLQAVQTWQYEVAVGNFIGKNPQETLTFLNRQGATCEPYWSGEMLEDEKNIEKKMGKRGFVTAHTGPVAHTFSIDGLQTWYITIGFNFDSHDKCQSSIITWGPR